MNRERLAVDVELVGCAFVGGPGPEIISKFSMTRGRCTLFVLLTGMADGDDRQRHV